MAITNQLTWLERVQQTLAIERESDAFTLTNDDNPEQAFVTRDDVENLQCEIGQHLLRIVPKEQLEQCGGTGTGAPPRVGLVRNDFSSGDAIEQCAVRIVAATMQTASNQPFLPAHLKSTAEYVQIIAQPATTNERWFTLFGGTVIHSGYRLRMIYVIEPQLTDFQADSVFLPPAGYAEVGRDWVHHQITSAADWGPPGRI